ncbi:MAG: hypothetical protein ABFD92_00285 [Planctomycetaceae bacterium]|nr:hypothetical protein [Planctomycetaceae bacterium]
MSTVRERLETAMAGGTPDKTPLGIYGWFLGDTNNLSDDAKVLVDAGLGLIVGGGTVGSKCEGVEWSNEQKKEGNDTFYIHKLKTPVGELRKASKNGWHYEDWIKQPADYKVWQWMVEHTEVFPSYEGYLAMEERLGQRGLPIVGAGRTPIMEINIDIAGTERFCMDIAMEVPELLDLYEAMKKLHRKRAEIMAAGPGKIISYVENLTIGMIGPKRYSDFMVSIYNDCFPLYHAAGKLAAVHYDGEVNCIRNEIAAAPMDIMESLTEPPEGDMMYEDCRRLWPNKAFLGNINVGLYYKTRDELAAAVVDKRNRAGKNGLAFEVSEDMPRNWKDSIPIVLETLEQMD